jgi:flagellum-specific peptidoglycan hydrolase FlgJ
MEPRLGHDFSRVRIHDDARAAESARAVQASAWTVGNDIAFDRGRFSPSTSGGRRLLAHELTHVVQSTANNAPRQSPASGLVMASAQADTERAASRVEDAIDRGDDGAPGGASPPHVLHRKQEPPPEEESKKADQDAAGGSGPPKVNEGQSKAAFYAKYHELAEKSEKETGVPALVTLGQAALESGWGKSAPGNMFFGVKAKASDPPESRQLLKTREVLSRPDVKFPEVISVTKRADGKYDYVVRDWFRKYSSAEGSFTDHGKFLRNNSRYKKAFEHSDDPYAFAQAIADAGYATATDYAGTLKKMMRLFEGFGHSGAGGARRDGAVDAGTPQPASDKKSKPAYPFVLGAPRGQGSVTASSLNVRNGPGANYEKTGALPKGAAVTTYGSVDGWYCIAPGQWVSREFVSLGGPQASAVTQRQPGPDMKSIARDVWDAMFGGIGLGTDEDKVYSSLAKLNRNNTLIRRFMDSYRASYGTDVIQDIESEFSDNWLGAELAKALSYLNVSANLHPGARVSQDDTRKPAQGKAATAGSINKVGKSAAIEVIERLQEQKNYRYADFVYKKYPKKVEARPQWKGIIEGNWAGWCASAVSMLFAKITGRSERGDGKDWDSVMKKLIARGDVAYRVETNPVYASLPTASVLVWVGGTFGHVCIVVDGLWYSDFYSQPLRQMKGAKPPDVVFVPRSSGM